MMPGFLQLHKKLTSANKKTSAKSTVNKKTATNKQPTHNTTPYTTLVWPVRFSGCDAAAKTHVKRSLITFFADQPTAIAQIRQCCVDAFRNVVLFALTKNRGIPAKLKPDLVAVVASDKTGLSTELADTILISLQQPEIRLLLFSGAVPNIMDTSAAFHLLTRVNEISKADYQPTNRDIAHLAALRDVPNFQGKLSGINFRTCDVPFPDVLKCFDHGVCVYVAPLPLYRTNDNEYHFALLRCIAEVNAVRSLPSTPTVLVVLSSAQLFLANFSLYQFAQCFPKFVGVGGTEPQDALSFVMQQFADLGALVVASSANETTFARSQKLGKAFRQALFQSILNSGAAM